MAYMTSQAMWGQPVTESGTSDRKDTQSPRTHSQANTIMSPPNAIGI